MFFSLFIASACHDVNKHISAAKLRLSNEIWRIDRKSINWELSCKEVLHTCIQQFMWLLQVESTDDIMYYHLILIITFYPVTATKPYFLTKDGKKALQLGRVCFFIVVLKSSSTNCTDDVLHLTNLSCSELYGSSLRTVWSFRSDKLNFLGN